MNALIILFIFSYALYAFNYSMITLLVFAFLVIVYTVLTQVVFFKTPFTHMRNKVTVASWQSPSDPQIYAKIKLDVTKISEYLEKRSKEEGKKMTLTLFSIKLLSMVIKKVPQLNSYIKYGVMQSKDDVDLCCLVAIGDGADLANAVVKSCNKKSLNSINTELEDNVTQLRQRKNKDHNQKSAISSKVPNFILSLLIQASSYFSSIGVGLKALGMKPFEFGTCIITSIGSIGISDGYPPIPPPTFCPLLVSVCKAKNKVVMQKDGSLKEVKLLGLNLTADFRFVDAKAIREFVQHIERIGQNPEEFEKECKENEKL